MTTVTFLSHKRALRTICVRFVRFTDAMLLRIPLAGFLEPDGKHQLG
jgi:hypothetical protein